MRVPEVLPVVLLQYRLNTSFHYTPLLRLQAPVEHLGPGPVAQGLMRPKSIVEPEVVFQPPLGLEDVGVGFQVHFFVLHCPPQPLHEDVVLVRPLPVHAGSHAAVLEDLGELPTGELASLVSVEHLRLALAQSLLQRLGAKAGQASLRTTL